MTLFGYTLVKESSYRLLVTAAAQVDYGMLSRDWNCLDAAAHHAALALTAIGEKTAAEERSEEEEEEEEEEDE